MNFTMAMNQALIDGTICKAHVFESGICPAKNAPIQKETEIPIDTNIHQPDVVDILEVIQVQHVSKKPHFFSNTLG